MGFDPNFLQTRRFDFKNISYSVAIRPSIRADFLASTTYEDDLTHKLADVVKVNEKLRKQTEKELIVVSYQGIART